jgi:hypothetical protein
VRPSFGRAGTQTGTPMPFAMAFPPVAAGAYVRVRQDTSAAAGIADFRATRPLGFEPAGPAGRPKLAELAIACGIPAVGLARLSLGGGLDVGIDVVLQAQQRLPGTEGGVVHTDA